MTAVPRHAAAHDTSPAERDLERLRALIDRTLERARPPFPFASLAEAEAEVARRARALEAIRANIDKSLVILLLGGTGVGKSSMLNALAGREVARTSSVRPCTTAATFYAADVADIDALREIVERDDCRVEGAGPSLRGKVIVDPPDFDSSDRENRLKLLRMLEVADLVLVVANRVKYRQATLFDLLRRFQGAKTFAFVLNMCDDPLFTPDVADDWRVALAEAGFDAPRTFVVSALRASEARAGGLRPDAEAGDFAALEQMIHDELEARRIAEIKRVNLEGARADLLAELRRLTPEPAAFEPAAWGEALDRIEAQALRTLVREVRIALFDRGPDLAGFLQDHRIRRVEGTFGLFATALTRARRLVPGRAALPAAAPAPARGASRAAAPDDPDDAEAEGAHVRGLAAAQAAIRRQIDRIPRRRVKQALDGARRDALDLARARGLRDDLAAEALPDGGGRDLAARALDEVSLALEDELEERLAAEPAAAAPWWRVLFSPWNLAPNLCLGVGLAHFLRGFLLGQVAFGPLLAGVLLALVACAAQFLHLQRRADQDGDALRALLLRRAEEVFSHHLGSWLTGPFGSLMASAHRWASDLRGDAPPPPGEASAPPAAASAHGAPGAPSSRP